MKNHTNAKFTLIAAAIAALFAVASFSAAADDVKAGGPSNKPSRALDDGPMKSEGASSQSGRVPAINDEIKPGGVKKYSRAAAGATDKPGRTADADSPKVKTGGVKKQPRTIDDGTVKASGTTEKPGRTVDTAKK